MSNATISNCVAEEEKSCNVAVNFHQALAHGANNSTCMQTHKIGYFETKIDQKTSVAYKVLTSILTSIYFPTSYNIENCKNIVFH